jgi:DNA modification methylase
MRGGQMARSLIVEEIALGELRPYERNARTHSPAQVEQVAASVREFGWTNPLLIDEDGLIIAGHGRLAAAKLLGLAAVPCIRVVGLSDQQKRALAIADNKLALNAGWDEGLLAAELQSLGDLQGLVGFSEDELVRLFKGHAGLTDPDEAPEAPADPVSQHGDVWLLGTHRLLCGDATSAEDVARVLGKVKPHLMVTDPPYGVGYNPTWRDDAGGQFGDGKTKMRGKVENDNRVDWSTAWALFPGDVAYVWSAPGALQIASFNALLASGFDPRYQIVWRKSHFVLSRGDYHWQHEPCWYAIRKSATAHWVGGRKQTTVWDIAGMNPAGRNRDLGNEKTGHGTQKPVECMRRPIENNSSAGQTVYDPFVGSGTTIIAAEMMGRACHALEISPAYVDVAVTRWQNFTGKQATDEAGVPFGEVAAQRQAKAA